MSWDGDRQLACAVIDQAVTDAFGVRLRDTRTDGNAHKATLLERDQARRFLVSLEGEWRKARELWCALAGLDCDALRDRMMLRLLMGAAG